MGAKSASRVFGTNGAPRTPGPTSSCCNRCGLLVVLVAVLCRLGVGTAQAWSFSDQTTAAGLSYQHGYVAGAGTQARMIAGGVAAGDYDGDGWVDLYAVHGDIGPNLLFHNRGDGTFEEVAQAAGVALTGLRGAGPVFADYDGDGRLDLLVLGVESNSRPLLFHNRGDGTFEDVTVASGIVVNRNSFSASWGDYDRDGDLDLFITHWGSALGTSGSTQNLWRNNGDGTFTDVSETAGISAGMRIRGAAQGTDYSFTANFADLNNDGWPDLVISADFGTSMVFVNQQNGTFAYATDPAVITDQNGMGGTVADYDGDGNLDWFVTSIANPASGKNGNRLYRGHGDGTFEDTTAAAGVGSGYWGWGCTFADLNNDGNVDIYHVNGFGDGSTDPSRLFVANGDGSFTEQSAALGVDDQGSGRGVVAFDYDHDGDLDLFIANNSGPSRFYRNDGGNAQHWLDVRLRGLAPNTEAIGARVFVSTGMHTQFRELRAGSNFESQDPAIAHFGLGSSATIDTLRVLWPDGAQTVSNNVAADQVLVVTDLRATPTPTATSPTRTPTPTPTSTFTRTPVLLSPTPSRTPTATSTVSPSNSPTNTRTTTATLTPSSTPTTTRTQTPTNTGTATRTVSPTSSPTLTRSATATMTQSATNTSTVTTTATRTATLAATPTSTPTLTPSATLTTTPTAAAPPVAYLNLVASAASPGGIACVAANLNSTGTPVGRAGNDLQFDPAAFTPGECVINPSIGSGSTTAATMSDVVGAGAETITVSTSGSTSLPEDTLYTCAFTVAADRSDGLYPIGCAAFASDVLGGDVATMTADADVVVTDCTGDCDGDGQVTIGEVIRVVRIFLGQPLCDPHDPSLSCPVADTDHSNSVSIAEVIQSANRFMTSCAQ